MEKLRRWCIRRLVEGWLYYPRFKNLNRFKEYCNDKTMTTMRTTAASRARSLGSDLLKTESESVKDV